MEDIVFKVGSTLQTSKLVSRHGLHEKYFSVRVLSASGISSWPKFPTYVANCIATVFKFLESNFAVNVVSIQICFFFLFSAKNDFTNESSVVSFFASTDYAYTLHIF